MNWYKWEIPRNNDATIDCEVLKETAPEGYQIDADVDDCADMIDLLNRPAEAQETQEAHVLSVGSSSRARSPPHPRAEPNGCLV